MSFKDFSTAQKTSNKDASAVKSKSALDSIEVAKPSDKDAAKDTATAKN